jgi:spoIIIJ-associated protein
MPQKLFFSGNTLQQALLAAARHFQIEPEAVAFEPREKRRGLVRGSGKVVIEVDPQAPRRGAAAREVAAEPAPAAARHAPPPVQPPPPFQPPPLPRRGSARSAATGAATGVANGAAVEPARQALRELLALGGLELDGTIDEDAEGLTIELAGADEELILAEDGELLRALEHLLRRALRSELGESRTCRLDARGFRRSHEARLEQMARAAADEVRRSGSAQRLPRMNPADRRLIHMTLAEEPGVTTASDGDGFFKTVVVQPE